VTGPVSDSGGSTLKVLAATTPPPSRELHGRWPAARFRRLGLQTTPGRIRALAAVVVLAIAGFYIVANIAVGNVRDGLRVIGHDAGPQVLATGDLYFALSDMDSQVASILLTGREYSAGTGQQALNRYGQDRARADRAALQAAELSAGDPTDQAAGSGSTSGSPARRWCSTRRPITQRARHRAM